MTDTAIVAHGLTIDDLSGYPMDDGNRYELIDGDLHVTTQPHWRHQFAADKLQTLLNLWSEQTRGGLALTAPGVIFDPYNAVAPDVIWLRADRLHLLDEDGKLHGAPDLAVEVLSQGTANEQRDRTAKREKYDHYGVAEYWIVDRFERQVEVYRRDAGALTLAAQLGAQDDLTSPLLPGFVCPVRVLFR